DAIGLVLDAAGKGHANAEGEAVTQGACSGFDAGDAVGAGMLGEAAAVRVVLVEYVRGGKTPLAEGDVEGEGGVCLAEEEAGGERVVGMVGVDLENGAVHRGEDVDAGGGGAEVRRPRRVRQLDDALADAAGGFFQQVDHWTSLSMASRAA